MAGRYVTQVELRTNIEKVLEGLKETQDRVDKLEGKDHKINLDIDTKTLESAIQKLDKMLDSLGKGTGDFKQFENLSKELSSIVSEVQSLSKAFGKVDDSGAKTLLSSIQNIDKSLSELSQNILNVNKNMSNMGGNTSGAVKQVENISNAYQDAAKEAEKLADAQSKIGQKTNISSGNSDYKSQRKGMKLEYFDGYTDKYDESINAYEQNVVRVVETTDKFAVDAEISCAKAETAVQKFVDSIGNQFPGLQSELNSIKENMSELSDLPYADGANSFGFEPTSDGKGWYVYLNVLKEVQDQAEKTTQAVKEVYSTASQDQTKDAFPKTSENLEQVAQSEQKVQQEAVATDKALDNISFTPNTEGFDDIIAKFGILREQAEQITKIVKTTKQTADGADISYKATLKNGSSYYLGENSTPQVLNANETVYDSKAIEKAYQEATKVNNALNETNSLLNSLKVPNGFEGSFSTLESEIKRLNSEFGSGKISATEYANSIKKAFSDYQTPIDNHSKDIWNELTTSLDRYTTLQKRIASNNALSTDNEEAIKLLEHIHELQRSDVLPSEKLNESNKKLQQINQTVTDLKAKLKESTLDSLQGSIDKYQRAYNNYSVRPSNEQSGAYKNALINLNSAIQELEKYKATLSGMSEVTEKQEAHIEKLVSECVKASDAFKQMSASQKGAKEIGIAKSIQRINKDLAENTRYSKTAKQNLQALLNQLESGDPSINLEKINSEMIKIENAEIRAGRAGKSFLDIFKTKAVHGFLGQAQSYLSMYIGFYGMVNKVRSTITTVKELDTALVDLKKTTTMNEQQLNKFYYSSNDVARQMGVTTKEIIEQASAWSRLNKIGLLYGDI